MGKIVIFSAPSGSGKTTIIKKLMEIMPVFEFSISATSRGKRQGEQHGIDYYFWDVELFRKKIENEEFLEWEEVYKDQYYGTLKAEVKRIIENGSNAIFDVDVKGGVNIKQYYGDEALSLFIMPPSIDVLEERLRKRNTDSEEQIQKRIAKAQDELTFAKQFDVIIVNEDLDVAINETFEMVSAFITD